jgi:hypothetical protein
MPKRTTVTLDDDVMEKLQEEAADSGEPFRATLNRMLRRGLNPPRRPAGTKPFRIAGRRLLEARPGISFDSIEDVLDQVEGPERK